MKLHPGVLQQIQKDAALAQSQGWLSVPVSPTALLALVESYEPPDLGAQAQTILTQRAQLSDARSMLKQAQRDNQRKFADGVAEGRRIQTDKMLGGRGC